MPENILSFSFVLRQIFFADVPEEPYLEYNGKQLSHQSTITVRENTVISVNCVMKGMSSVARTVNWFVGDTNQTHQSKLLMEYSAEEEMSLTISVLTINVTTAFNQKWIVCRIAQQSWSNTVTITALFNVLCKNRFLIWSFRIVLTIVLLLSSRCANIFNCTRARFWLSHNRRNAFVPKVWNWFQSAQCCKVGTWCWSENIKWYPETYWNGSRWNAEF